MMDGLVEIYLPDLKYKDAALSKAYSGAAGYFDVAQAAIQEMYRQTGPLQWGANGVLQRGLMVRHLLLPGCRKDSMAVLEALSRPGAAQAHPFEPDEPIHALLPRGGLQGDRPPGDGF